MSECVFCGKEVPEGQRQCSECYGEDYAQLMQWMSDKINSAFGVPADLFTVRQGTLCRSYEGERPSTGDQNRGSSLQESTLEV